MKCHFCKKEHNGQKVTCEPCLIKKRDYYRRKVKDDKCFKCGGPKSGTKTTCDTCYDITRKRHQNRYKNGKCMYCCKPLEGRLRRCQDCAEVANEGAKRRRKRAWDTVYNYYGEFCACCGETERVFLSIDHKNNDGYAERKLSKGMGILRSAEKAILEGSPRKDLQILCCNCNFARFRNKICPHQLQRTYERSRFI